MGITKASQAKSPRVDKTVGVYEKPAGPRIPRAALFAVAIAVAASIGAAALYWL